MNRVPSVEQFAEQTRRLVPGSKQPADSFLTRIESLIEDVREGAPLSLLGHRLFRNEILRTFIQRSKFELALDSRAAALAGALSSGTRVTVITGMPRTRSTWLHNV